MICELLCGFQERAPHTYSSWHPPNDMGKLTFECCGNGSQQVSQLDCYRRTATSYLRFRRASTSAALNWVGRGRRKRHSPKSITRQECSGVCVCTAAFDIRVPQHSNGPRFDSFRVAGFFAMSPHRKSFAGAVLLEAWGFLCPDFNCFPLLPGKCFPNGNCTAAAPWRSLYSSVGRACAS